MNKTEEPWVNKYRPKTLSELVGNEKTIKKILEWLKLWNNKKPKKRAILLYGPVGVGKTSSIESIANDFKMELIQTNASNFRTSQLIINTVGKASEINSLFGNKKIILLDELDGISGSADRGGLRTITNIIKKTRFPIILIVSNAYNPRFSTLRKYCQLIKFNKIDKRKIAKKLKTICLKEGIEVEEEALKYISSLSKGDLRSAINDLQALAQDKNYLSYKDVVWFSSRDKNELIFDVLREIFYGKDISTIRKFVGLSEIEPDMLFEWIYENLPYHIKKYNELSKAIEILANADIYRNRIKTTQNWSFMRYFIDLMTVGVTFSGKKRISTWKPFKFPSRILFLSRSRAQRQIQRNIGEKISKKCHISINRAITEVIPYLRIIFQNKPRNTKNIGRWLELDNKSIEYLEKN